MFKYTCWRLCSWLEQSKCCSFSIHFAIVPSHNHCWLIQPSFSKCPRGLWPLKFVFRKIWKQLSFVMRIYALNAHPGQSLAHPGLLFSSHQLVSSQVSVLSTICCKRKICSDNSWNMIWCSELTMCHWIVSVILYLFDRMTVVGSSHRPLAIVKVANMRLNYGAGLKSNWKVVGYSDGICIIIVEMGISCQAGHIVIHWVQD